ncbi:Dual oxidase maturation factor 2 [Bulinus truncatus]|nr:Dual oxidase maturation factor 2 [Bulinus truncatus]
MTWFKAFRNEYGFMLYRDNVSAVSYDIPLLVVTYFCVLISIATILATLGIRGHERWSAVLRATFSLGIGSIILACIYGHGWQLGELGIKMPYVYRNNFPFEGQVGINVALDGANATLHGYYYGPKGAGLVHYAESMPWADYGEEFKRFSYFLSRGLPAPILKVMEYLTVDSGGMRWGRSFHTAGQYAMALLWTAFSFWIVTNILLFSVIVYGAYMCSLTGLSMILACVAYHSCQNALPLTISFGDDNLTLRYGWCFWLTLAAGILTLLVGVILFLLDSFAPQGVSEFFKLEKIIDEDHVEIEDRRVINPNLLMDRRGSIVPPPSDRRGSIFLDPSRKPSHFSENRPKSMSLGELTGVGKFKEDLLACKKNPLFRNDDEKAMRKKSNQNEGDDVSVNMECLCEDSEVCISTRKPSLATLKEHRENHANELLSMSGNSQRESESTAKTPHPENVKVPRVSFSQPETQPSITRRSSDGEILKSSPEWDRPVSGSSAGFSTIIDLEKKLEGGGGDDQQSVINCGWSGLSRRDSTDSSGSESSGKSNMSSIINCIIAGQAEEDERRSGGSQHSKKSLIDVTIDIERQHS